MNTNPDFQSIVFDAGKIPNIDLIEREILNTLSDSKGAIRDMCLHVLNAGGKRIRPLLVLYSGLAFSASTNELINAAVAAELIHMASLVHDDIIDKSYLRRQKPSVNSKWGSHYAVLCGDYLFAKAFAVLSNNRLLKSMDYMVEAIQQMCHGEIIQAEDRFRLDADYNNYYQRISKKTAIFLECCCRSGAAVVGADDAYINILGDYGLNLGLAFQIIDDILDFCGDAQVMGKPRGEDLKQGIITLPVIILLSKEEYSVRFQQLVRKKGYGLGDFDQILDMLYESGAIKEAYAIAQNHIDKAQQCLSLLPETGGAAFLSELTDMLRARMN